MDSVIQNRGSAEIRRSHVYAEVVDQYGDVRVIHRTKGKRLSVKRQGNTPAHALNRVATVLIGERIRAMRCAKGLSLAELALKAGLSAGAGQHKQRMYEIEKSTRSEGVRMGTLFAIALALECEVKDLIPLSEEVSSRAGVSFSAKEMLST